MRMKALLLAFVALPASALAQVNAGTLPESSDLPFAVKEVAKFDYPWRLGFISDRDMLITEKPGKLWLASTDGKKREVSGVPEVAYGGQGGLLGVYAGPEFQKDRRIYLTYSEPGKGGSSLALASATLSEDDENPALVDLEVIWREQPKGKGGQFGGAVAFSPDQRFLFLTVGDRQRMTPAQDPDLPQGKILRLTLDGKPAPGNPYEGQQGAKTVPLINPPADTEAAKTAPVISRYTFDGSNLTPAETWSTGHRTPYGLAFSPDGRLWELEHGPRGGDELNLIEPGKNYGWPLVSYARNYNGTPIPSPDTRPDLEKPVIYWTPVIAPGNFTFYSGTLFREWKGSAFVGGLAGMNLSRISFDGKGGAKPEEKWSLGFRVRDVAEGPDGALWLLEDASGGGLYRITPK